MKRWYDCKIPIVVSASPIFSTFWRKSELLQEKELHICLSGLLDQILPLEIMLGWWNESQQTSFLSSWLSRITFSSCNSSHYAWVTQYLHCSLITWILIFLTNIIFCWPTVENMLWSVPWTLLVMFIKQLEWRTQIFEDYLCMQTMPMISLALARLHICL